MKTFKKDLQDIFQFFIEIYGIISKIQKKQKIAKPAKFESIEIFKNYPLTLEEKKKIQQFDDKLKEFVKKKDYQTLTRESIEEILAEYKNNLAHQEAQVYFIETIKPSSLP